MCNCVHIYVYSLSQTARTTFRQSMKSSATLHKAIEDRDPRPGSISQKDAVKLAQGAADKAGVGKRTVFLFDIPDGDALVRNLTFEFDRGHIRVNAVHKVEVDPTREAYGLSDVNLGMVNSDRRSFSEDLDAERRLHAPFKRDSEDEEAECDLTFVVQGKVRKEMVDKLQYKHMEHLGGQPASKFDNRFLIFPVNPPRSASLSTYLT